MKRSKPQRPESVQRQHREQAPAEAANFSPEAISQRSSAQTEVLKEMLDRDKPSYFHRYYGINE